MPVELVERIHRFERHYGGLHLFNSVHDARLAVPWHTHQHASMYVVLAGSIRERRASGDHEVDAGGFVFAPEDETHENVVAESGARCFLVEFDRSWIDGARPPGERLESPVGVAAFLMLRLLADAVENDELASQESAWRVLGELTRVSFRRQRACPRWILRTEDQLRAEFTRRLTLDTLARNAGVHPVYLAAAFRAQLGCTIGTYIRRLRVARACSLLAAGVSIADVSLRTGFADQSQFTKTFARLMAVPPGAFRRRALQI